MLNNQQHISGFSAELYVAYKAAEAGFEVFMPLATQSKVDMILVTGKEVLKVQVKKATKSSANGFPFIQIRLGGCGRMLYKKGDFDVLVMVYEGRIWVLPYEFVEDNTSMSFSIFTDKPRRDISMYEWESFVKENT